MNNCIFLNHDERNNEEELQEKRYVAGEILSLWMLRTHQLTFLIEFKLIQLLA